MVTLAAHYLAGADPTSVLASLLTREVIAPIWPVVRAAALILEQR